MVVDLAVARRYAQALVNALEASHRTGPGLDELGLISRTYAASHDLQRFLGSPEISPEEKWALLKRLFSDVVGPEVMGLLGLLLKRDRVPLVPALASEAKAVAEARQGLLRGEMTTAHPISTGETERLSQVLGKVLGKQVVLERHVDPHLIGGVRITVGTTLLDGSIQTALRELKDQLMTAKVN